MLSPISGRTEYFVVVATEEAAGLVLYDCEHNWVGKLALGRTSHFAQSG